MLRHTIVVIAIVFVLGSSGRSNAFARGGGYGVGGDGFCGDRFGGGFDRTPGDGHSGYGNRHNGLHGGFRGYGGRDVWGHWGSYYGPMIPNIF